MFRRYALVLAITLFIAHAASGQTVARAYADNDGKAHVAFANGVDKIIKPEPEQVGCADVSVADDGRTVGWSVLVQNCCTSYPISTSIVVYKDGHQHVITTRQMIWKWRFIEGGSQIAVLSGPRSRGSIRGSSIRLARKTVGIMGWEPHPSRLGEELATGVSALGGVTVRRERRFNGAIPARIRQALSKAPKARAGDD